MKRKPIAILFLILFVALITAPSIIVALDDSTDVSIFYSITEEEENHNIKIVPNKEHIEVETLFASSSNDNLGYCFKSYLNPHLNIISPPPDFI